MLFFRFIHLTNNSISKNHENFISNEISGYMWSMKEFSSYLIVLFIKFKEIYFLLKEKRRT